MGSLHPPRQVPAEARRPTRSLILPVPLPVTLPVFPPGVLVGVLAVPLLPVSSFSPPPGPPGGGDVLGGVLGRLP